MKKIDTIKNSGDGSIPTACDVVIVGAGIAGSASAIQLAKAGYKVVIIEKSGFDMPRIGESLAPGVQPLLKRLGLWKQFLELEPLPSYGTRSIWGSSDPVEHSHLFTVHLNGWHIDRLAFDRMLALNAMQAGAQLYTGSRVIDCKPGESGFVLNIADNGQQSQLHSKFLIDASGRSSLIASRLKAQKILFDRLVGVAAQFNDDNAGRHCYIMIESTQHGWWYLAPVSSDKSIVMLITDGDLVGRQQRNLLHEWQEAMQETTGMFSHFKGRSIIWGPRVFSAVSQRTIRSPGDQQPWLSVGDASLSVDPISGSGVIRALNTANAAALTTQAVLNGDHGAIDRYEVERNIECDNYLFELGEYYGMENRWPASVFWRRRAVALKQYLSDTMAQSTGSGW